MLSEVWSQKQLSVSRQQNVCDTADLAVNLQKSERATVAQTVGLGL